MKNSEIDDGGPIAPNMMTPAGPMDAVGGLTIRDWFAGMAIQGAAMYINEHEDSYENTLKHLGESGYRIADAMLAARKEGA